VVPAAVEMEDDMALAWLTVRDETSSLADIQPGYLCGLALERVGTRLLYGTRVFMLAAKLLHFNHRVTRGLTGKTTRNLTLRNLGLIIQESIDILR
jgi:hypothetical protein